MYDLILHRDYFALLIQDFKTPIQLCRRHIGESNQLIPLQERRINPEHSLDNDSVFRGLKCPQILNYTWLGRAFRASSQNRVGVQTAGINVLRIDQIAFALGITLAGVAGALLAPVFNVFPENGAVTTMKGFEIIIIGGMGSLPGAAIGGLLLGIIESLGSVFIGSSLRNVYGFVFLIIILLIKPTGLFGEKERLS